VEKAGLLPPIPAYIDSTYVCFEFAVTMAGVTGLLALTTSSFAQTLRRARQSEREIDARNHELLTARAALEERNAHLRAVVERYDAFMAQVGQGNLAGQLELEEVEPGDPLVALGRRLNETTAGLRQVARQTSGMSGELQGSADAILAAATQQATGAAEQSAAITQATTTIDEVRAIADQTAQRAQGVADLSQRTADVARAGQQVAGMEQIAQAMHNIQAVTAQTVAGTRQTEGVARELDALAGRLAEVTARYRV